MKKFIGSVLLISDTHMGDGSEIDDFKLDDILLELIENKKPSHIILVGDIYERWKFSMKSIRKAHSRLVKFFETDRRVVHIRGNHDFTLFGRESITFKYNNKVYHAIHGHQSNLIGMLNPITALGVFVYSLIQKHLYKTSTIFEQIYYSVDTTQKDTEKYASILLKKKKYDVIIYGHTHKFYLSDTQINTGSCYKQLQYVLLN